MDLHTFFAAWPDPAAGVKANEYRRLQAEFDSLAALDRNEVRPVPKTVPFRGADRPRAEVPAMLDQVRRESAAVRELLTGLDRRVFAAHAQAARELDGEAGPRTAELGDRYRFHGQVQKLIDQLRADDGRLRSMFGFLSGAGAEMRLFNQIVKTFKDVEASLAACLTTASDLKTPALANVPAGTPLRDLVRGPGPELPRLPDRGYTIESNWINTYLIVRAGVEARLVRVRTKNLGQILKLQERIEERWRREQ